MLRTEELDYPLPEDLIATRPEGRRDEARLMVLRRGGEGIEHRRVRDLPALLRAGDLLVVNDTRVIPARFLGRRLDTGGRIEGLYLETLGHRRWRVMLQSGGRLREGVRVGLWAEGAEGTGEPGAALRLERKCGAEWEVTVESAEAPEAVLDRLGHAPLPPYILRARKQRGEGAISENEERARYQTIYARRAGAVAAPTAGLHFTPELMDRLEAADIERAAVTLHVGAGTFKPVETEYVQQHPMHAERFEAPAATLASLRRARERGGRIVAVGTTSVRVLESLPEPLPPDDVRGETRLLIAPGYEFRWTDALLTNFHLPRSTLLALVGAMTGLDRLMEAYREAVRCRYRFYSYGDAMLILP